MDNVNLDRKLDKGGKGTMKDLPLLPEREWLNAVVVEVKYEQGKFNGQPAYLTDYETKEQILDDSGNPIPRMIFNITFELPDHVIPNTEGINRKCWLTLGASLNEKAHLPHFLFNVCGKNTSFNTPRDVITKLEGKTVRLQLKNKPDKNGKIWQNVVWDAVQRVMTEEEKTWEES